MSQIVTIQTLTMSSREIAELTGKDLSHVNRDIRAMLDALVDDPELDHVREDKDARGYTTAFHLGRELTYTLMAGYSVQLRRKVIARWQELEAAQAPDLSTDEGRLLMIQELSTKQLALVRENKVQAQQLALDELDVYSLNVKRARIFKQWVIDKGLGELKQTELGYSQPLFTTAGEAWIVERLTSEGVAC